VGRQQHHGGPWPATRPPAAGVHKHRRLHGRPPVLATQFTPTTSTDTCACPRSSWRPCPSALVKRHRAWCKGCWVVVARGRLLPTADVCCCHVADFLVSSPPKGEGGGGGGVWGDLGLLCGWTRDAGGIGGEQASRGCGVAGMPSPVEDTPKHPQCLPKVFSSIPSFLGSFFVGILIDCS